MGILRDLHDLMWGITPGDPEVAPDKETEKTKEGGKPKPEGAPPDSKGKPPEGSEGK